MIVFFVDDLNGDALHPQLTIRLCEGRFSPQHDVTIGVEFGSCIVPVGGSGAQSSSANGTTASSLRRAMSSSSPSQPSSQGQKHMKLSLWDTAGQETYKSVTRSYFRGASGALLVFDLTRRESFLHVTDWLNDLRQIAEPDIVVVLVGNKRDLVEDEEEEEEGEKDEEADGQPQTAATPAATAADPAEAPSQGPSGHGRGGPRGRRRQVTSAEAVVWCEENSVLRYVETSAKSGHNVELAFLELANRIYDNIEAGRYDLNDRRSGVKGAGAAAAAAGGRLGANSPARTVTLRMNDDGGGARRGGVCC